MLILWQDVGVDVRHGGAALRQLGSAAAHCKLDPSVSFLVKQLYGQEIYRYPLDEQKLLFISSSQKYNLLVGIFIECSAFLEKSAQQMQYGKAFRKKKGAIRKSDFNNLCDRYALMEMAQDLPDLPIGMLTDLHLKRG